MNPLIPHKPLPDEGDAPVVTAHAADFLDRAKRFLESCAREHRATATAPRSELDIILCALLGPAALLQHRRDGPAAAIRAILIEKP